MEASSWMDWWHYAGKSLFSKEPNEKSRCYHLLVAAARSKMMMAWTALVLWASSVFRCLVKLQNTVIYCLTELFSSLVVLRASEKLNRMHHDEDVRNVVSFEKLSHSLARKIQFAHSVLGLLPNGRSNQLPEGSHPERELWHPKRLSLPASLGKKF